MRAFFRCFIVVLTGLVCGAAARSQVPTSSNPTLSFRDVSTQDMTINQLVDRIATRRVDQVPPKGRVDASRPIPRAWKLLTIASGAAVTLDMATTTVADGHEEDPLARPIVKLPTPAYFAVGYTEAAAVDWLGLRMYRSRRWHRFWWVPQALQIGGNLFGASNTMSKGLCSMTPCR